MISPIKFDSLAILPIHTLGINNLTVISIAGRIYNRATFSLIKKPNPHNGLWINFRTTFANRYNNNQQNHRSNQNTYDSHRFSLRFQIIHPVRSHTLDKYFPTSNVSPRRKHHKHPVDTHQTSLDCHPFCRLQLTTPFHHRLRNCKKVPPFCHRMICLHA